MRRQGESGRPRPAIGGNARRDFLLGIGATSAAAAPAGSAEETPSPRTIKADVLVIGGGTAGAIAAIQAGRMGARTILVEAASQLGGTTSTGGVDFPGLFHAWGRQIIAGIGWDLVRATAALNGDPLPDFTVPYGTQHWRHQVRIHGGLYAAVAEEASVKAGVQLRYYETPLSIRRDGSMWRVHLAGKGTEVEAVVRQLVDCTGNAAAIGMIGLARQREAVTQPGTLIYRLTGYLYDEADLFDMEQKAREAVTAGRLDSADFRHSLRGFLAAGGENATHIPVADSSTSELHTQTNIWGRQSLLRMMRFLRPFPGFEKMRLAKLATEAGVRETFRIVGETTVTVDDYTSGRKFPDAVAQSFYPIDLHDEKGIRPRQLKEGTVPTIPLGALIPRASRDVMAAGRSVASDRLANSALRVQASSMAMGQAAGATSALAAELNVTPSKVPLAAVRKALRAHGAIVPE
jgi:hypothetical protein